MASTRKLAAIMFTDIVGFSASMGKDEALTMQMVRKNRDIQQPLVEKHNGKWLKEMGDGTLISFSTASEAVYCALEIQETIGSESGFQVRIGIHLGEIAVEDGDIYGDGVNIASRIEPLAEPGKVVVSHVVHSNIKNQEGIHSTFLKKVHVKNIEEPISIYGVSRVGTVETKRQISLKKVGMYIMPAVIILLAWLGYSAYDNDTALTEPEKQLEKSVVVLPFLDFSPEGDQEWFADGLTDELLNSLSRVPELRVIARTTSFALKGKDISIQKIADSLKVNYLVEGSVRKAGNKIKVTAQLINPELDDHIWSNTFEMEFEDIFDIQQDIAEGISDALNIYFDDETRENMFSTGTRNADAYEAYLRGNEFFNMAHSPLAENTGGLIKYLDSANTFYQEGIRLDPNFAAVYYRHQDLYVHYLLHHPDKRPKNLSENQVVDIVRRDFSNAIKNTNSRGEEIFYKLENAVISNDWSSVPALLDELEGSKEHLKAMSKLGLGWTSGLLIALDREDIGLSILNLELLSDPLNRNTKRQIYMYLTSKNMLDSARAWRYKEIDNTPDLMWEMNHAPEKIDEILPLIESNTSSEFDKFFASILTNNVEASQITEMVNQTTSEIDKYYSVVFYAARGEQVKADSVASIIDASFLGPTKLSDYLHATNGMIPFRLSATPNFSARLKEAGIKDLATYEEEHFHIFRKPTN